MVHRCTVVAHSVEDVEFTSTISPDTIVVARQDGPDETTEDVMDGLGCVAVFIAVIAVVGYFLWNDFNARYPDDK